MKKLLTVTKFSFIEVYRSKVMVSILFMALGLILITYVVSEFAYGAPAKVALDVGLGLVAISNLGMAIFIGATLINKEVEQRTLYMILSKPISRPMFLIGKMLGLSLVLLINTTVLTVLSAAIFRLAGGEIHPLIWWAAFFSFLESFLIMAIAILFSLITNTAMAVIYSLVMVVIGHSINETSKLIFAKVNPFFNSVVKIGNMIFPNLYKLNLKDFVIYQQTVPSLYLINVSVYFMIYLLSLMALVTYIFKNKNLD